MLWREHTSVSPPDSSAVRRHHHYITSVSAKPTEHNLLQLYVYYSIYTCNSTPSLSGYGSTTLALHNIQRTNIQTPPTPTRSVHNMPRRQTYRQSLESPQPMATPPPVALAANSQTTNQDKLEGGSSRKPTFTGRREDYQAWSRKMIGYLREKGLYGYIKQPIWDETESWYQPTNITSLHNLEINQDRVFGILQQACEGPAGALLV